jgi:hypothetical protein
VSCAFFVRQATPVTEDANLILVSLKADFIWFSHANGLNNSFAATSPISSTML